MRVLTASRPDSHTSHQWRSIASHYQHDYLPRPLKTRISAKIRLTISQVVGIVWQTAHSAPWSTVFPFVSCMIMTPLPRTRQDCRNFMLWQYLQALLFQGIDHAVMRCNVRQPLAWAWSLSFCLTLSLWHRDAVHHQGFA